MDSLFLDHVTQVTCLGAHADDIEIGCGGLLQHLLQRRKPPRINWIVLSSTPARRAEALASAQAYLDTQPDHRLEVFDFPDRLFPRVFAELKQSLGQLEQDSRSTGGPHLVLTHRLEDRHQDHRVVAELTWQAFRDHLILEYEIPKFEGDLGQPNAYFPISREVGQRKVQRLLEHFPTQREHDWFTADSFEALLRLRGLECRSPSRLAEGFTARKLVLGCTPDRAATISDQDRS